MKAFARALLVCLFVVSIPACTETDEMLVGVGAARILFTDPDQSGFTLGVPDSGIQVARWVVDRAELTVDGILHDLSPGGPCELTDIWFSAPFVTAPCGSGSAVGESVDPVPASLSLDVSMSVFRISPVDLPAGLDFDGDGVANDVDLCPLVADPGQTDADAAAGPDGMCGTGDDDNTELFGPDLTCGTADDLVGNGLGDACQGPDPLLDTEPDSDADGIVDLIDNCVAVANAAQDESDSPSDGIGDACEETAVVQLAGSSSFQLDFPGLSLAQPAGVVTFALVDFGSTTALSCNWGAGTCSLDAAQLAACFVDGTSVNAGCP